MLSVACYCFLLLLGVCSSVVFVVGCKMSIVMSFWLYVAVAVCCCCSCLRVVAVVAVLLCVVCCLLMSSVLFVVV